MSDTVTGKNRDWISVGEVAKYCLVTPVTVRRWIKGGKLSAIRLPSGHHRINIVDFRDFLERSHIPVEDWLLECKSEKKGGKQ